MNHRLALPGRIFLDSSARSSARSVAEAFSGSAFGEARGDSSARVSPTPKGTCPFSATSKSSPWSERARLAQRRAAYPGEVESQSAAVEKNAGEGKMQAANYTTRYAFYRPVYRVCSIKPLTPRALTDTRFYYVALSPRNRTKAFVVGRQSEQQLRSMPVIAPTVFTNSAYAALSPRTFLIASVDPSENLRSFRRYSSLRARAMEISSKSRRGNRQEIR